MWTPLPAEAVYYSTPSPADHLPSLPQLIASFAGSVPSDPTYGRSALERSPAEKRLRDEYPTRDGKVTMDDAGLVYVVYQVWEPKEGTKARGELFVSWETEGGLMETISERPHLRSRDQRLRG
jgi:hypothetical protein